MGLVEARWLMALEADNVRLNPVASWTLREYWVTKGDASKMVIAPATRELVWRMVK